MSTEFPESGKEILRAVDDFVEKRPKELMPMAWWVGVVSTLSHTSMDLAWKMQLEGEDPETLSHVRLHDAPFEWVVHGAGFIRVSMNHLDHRRIAGALLLAQEFAAREAAREGPQQKGWIGALEWVRQELSSRRAEQKEGQEG